MEPEPAVLELLKVKPEEIGGPVFRGEMCGKCHGSGYLGRTGVFEVFTRNDDSRHQISTNYLESELIKMTRVGGMRTLLEDGIEKVRLGRTTLEEILRVIGAQSRYEKPCEHCGRRIDAKHLYCPYCGGIRKNVCTKCNLALEDDWLICPLCGTSKG